MGGGQQGYTAVRRRRKRAHIRRIGDLVRRQHLGRHAAQQHQQSLRLRNTVQHIGAPPHIHLGRSMPERSHFAPLVRYGGAQTALIGQQPYHLPQKCRLARARRSQDQRTRKSTALQQGTAQRMRNAWAWPGDTDAEGRQLPKCRFSLLVSVNRTADANTVAALQRIKSPTQLLRRTLVGGMGGPFQHCTQIPFVYGTRQADHLFSPLIRHAQAPPRAQADLLPSLRPGTGCRPHGTPQRLRQKGQAGGKCRVIHLHHLSLCYTL